MAGNATASFHAFIALCCELTAVKLWYPFSEQNGRKSVTSTDALMAAWIRLCLGKAK
jgi:hypothetical protein